MTIETLHPARIQQLIIAGWTGRDRIKQEKHIAELEALGVRRPASTPVYYRVAAARITIASSIQVSGRDSSGEVEFVVFQIGGALWIGLGSDHTDRKAESIGVTLSKQLCPKIVAPEIWEWSSVAAHWDRLMLRSYATAGGARALYQQGSVSAMRHPDDLMSRYGGFPAGTAMFGGTFATIGGVRWADEFHIELEDPALGRIIRHSYTIEALPVEG